MTMTIRKMASCSVARCGEPVLSKGRCNLHYLRWRKYGDPLAYYRREPWTEDEDKMILDYMPKPKESKSLFEPIAIEKVSTTLTDLATRAHYDRTVRANSC